jgi:hypothetical protein
VAALVGILVANMFVDTSGNRSAAAPRPTIEPSVANAPLPPPLTTFSPPPAVTVTTTTDAPPAPENGTPTAAGMVSVLHAYTALLPDHPAQAFALLTPREQARNGGATGFVRTWGTVKSVQLGHTVRHGDDTVLARIKVSPRHGKSTDDVYSFRFVEQHGTVLIDDVSKVSHSRHG